MHSDEEQGYDGRRRSERRPRQPQGEEPTGRRWATVDVVASLMVGLLIGGVVGFKWHSWSGSADADVAAVEGSASPTAAAPATAAAAAASTDQFGRKPGEEHFGHNHPPQQGAAQAPAPAKAAPPTDGGPDQFGRKPGEEHYGHAHQ